MFIWLNSLSVLLLKHRRSKKLFQNPSELFLIWHLIKKIGQLYLRVSHFAFLIPTQKPLRVAIRCILLTYSGCYRRQTHDISRSCTGSLQLYFYLSRKWMVSKIQDTARCKIQQEPVDPCRIMALASNVAARGLCMVSIGKAPTS